MLYSGSPFAGMKVSNDPNALADTEERLFPESRHRSKRVKKKLIKRFGSEFRRVPAMFKIGNNTIVAHPARYAELKRMLDDSEAYRAKPFR